MNNNDLILYITKMRDYALANGNASRYSMGVAGACSQILKAFEDGQ